MPAGSPLSDNPARIQRHRDSCSQTTTNKIPVVHHLLQTPPELRESADLQRTKIELRSPSRRRARVGALGSCEAEGLKKYSATESAADPVVSVLPACMYFPRGQEEARSKGRREEEERRTCTPRTNSSSRPRPRPSPSTLSFGKDSREAPIRIHLNPQRSIWRHEQKRVITAPWGEGYLLRKIPNDGLQMNGELHQNPTNLLKVANFRAAGAVRKMYGN
ncbi:hypothetical protein B0H19DRAFT_1072126 [Mycena capillaripes]|nr:hypothetical protein B0H19DRAFT_1072126 [Mycena capillaripes]